MQVSFRSLVAVTALALGAPVVSSAAVATPPAATRAGAAVSAAASAAPAASPSLAVSPAPAGAPSAEALFAAMRAALLARRYPREIRYAVVVEGWDGKIWHHRTYDSFAFPSRDEIREKTVSREENADPYKPSGFGVSVGGFGVGGVGGSAPPDAIGVPRLSPAYAFGLVPSPRTPALPGPVASGAPVTIGEVSAVAKIYDVSLAGPETLLGRPCWHLKLAPIGDPGKYRVRDVWIAQADAQLVRLRTVGNFTAKATGAGSWTIDYASSDGSTWYVNTEASAGPVDADDSTTYARMRVRFVEIAPDAREIYDSTVPSQSVPLLEEP